MNDSPDRRFVDPKPKRNGANQDSNFIRHPALLIALSGAVVHFGVVGYGGDAFLGQEIDGLFHTCNGRRVHDDVVAGMGAQRRYQ